MNRKFPIKGIVLGILLLLTFALFQDLIIRWVVNATQPDIPKEVVILSDEEVQTIENPEITSFDDMVEYIEETLVFDEIISVSVKYNQIPITYEFTLLVEGEVHVVEVDAYRKIIFRKKIKNVSTEYNTDFDDDNDDDDDDDEEDDYEEDDDDGDDEEDDD